MTDKANENEKDGYAVLLHRGVRFIFKGIFNWNVMWASLALFSSHHGQPLIGMGCLILWVLFMILDQLKILNKKVSRVLYS